MIGSFYTSPVTVCQTENRVSKFTLCEQRRFTLGSFAPSASLRPRCSEKIMGVIWPALCMATQMLPAL